VSPRSAARAGGRQGRAGTPAEKRAATRATQARTSRAKVGGERGGDVAPAAAPQADAAPPLEQAPVEVSAPPPAEEGTTAGPTPSLATATAAAASAAPLVATLGAATLAATAAAATVAGLGADPLGAVKSQIDLERALNDPADLFETPDAVVHHPALTREQKIQILNNWQLDASRLEGSEGEGMMGEDAPMLHRVRVALAALTGQQ
jgi:hypothetical protein